MEFELSDLVAKIDGILSHTSSLLTAIQDVRQDVGSVRSDIVYAREEINRLHDRVTAISGNHHILSENFTTLLKNSSQMQSELHTQSKISAEVEAMQNKHITRLYVIVAVLGVGLITLALFIFTR